MSTSDQTWGGRVRLDFDFRQRADYVTSARRLIAELCHAELSTHEANAWVMVAQELLENLAKYAAPGRSSLDFELALRDARPHARLSTRNPASSERLDVAAALLERIVQAPDAVALYDELVAASGADRSRLGLIRIRAEAGLDLRYTVGPASLELEVTGAVAAREAEA